MRLILVVLCLAIGLVGVGCESAKPEKFESAVHSWVPLGTPLKAAQGIMEHHGFECRVLPAASRFNATGKTCLDCERLNVWMRNWNVRFFVVDDKISEYGDIIVD